jgi:UDP-3-O-[3-hydroxymyristoyl] N-acetylglucosamine deacetylase
VRTTALGPATHAVGLVEHLLGTLAGLGVWHARIEVIGPEIPVLDGSAREFVAAIAPRLRPASRVVPPLVLAREVRVARGEAGLVAAPLAPAVPARFEYHLEYPGVAGLHAQHAEWAGDAREFARAVAPARTFSTLAEAQAARRTGLFSHLTPREMVVIGPGGTPVDNAWRLPDEPARHKLLDLVGDLALLGRPLHAHVIASRAGHALTHELVRALLAEAG